MQPIPWARNHLILAHWFARDCVILRSFTDLQDFEYVDILQSALCGLLSGFPLVAPIHHANQMTAMSNSHLITFKDCFLPLDIDRWLPVSLKGGTDVTIDLEFHSVLHGFILLLKYLAGIPNTYIVLSVSFFVCRKAALSKCSISILLTSSPRYKHFPVLEYAQHTGGEHQKTILCHPTCRQDKTIPGDFNLKIHQIRVFMVETLQNPAHVAWFLPSRILQCWQRCMPHCFYGPYGNVEQESAHIMPNRPPHKNTGMDYTTHCKLSSKAFPPLSLVVQPGFMY